MITAAELNSVLYTYQLNEIVENDADIVEMNIAAAIEEVRSYLATRYDVDTIFSQTGNDRNPLILEIIKNVALWGIVRLSNVDIIYNQAKERYDRNIKWLVSVQRGEVSPDLPPITDTGGEVQTPFRLDSNQPKFNHYY